MTSKISGTVSPRISVHAQNSNAVPEEIPNAAIDARCRVPTETVGKTSKRKDKCIRV